MGMAHVSAPNETRGPQLLAITWTLVALSGLFLALRIFCKIFRGRGLWWDDHVLAFSWVCATVTNSFTTAAVALGYGHHYADIDKSVWPTMTLYTSVGGTPNIVAVATSKAAFALTLIRLTQGRLRILLWFVLGTLCLAIAVAATLLYVQCTPVAKNWNYSLPGTCWDPRKIIYFNTAVGLYSAATDFVLAFIGARTVWALQMKTAERVGVAVAMSMGVFAGMTSIMKSYYMSQLMFVDISYDAYYLILWGEAETTITIMAASIPVLRVLIKEVRSRPGTAPSKFSPSAVPSLNIPMSRPRISWPVNRVSGGKAGIRTDSDSGRSDIQMGDIRVATEISLEHADYKRGKQQDEEAVAWLREPQEAVYRKYREF